jgi:hypothetical protein
MGAFETNSMAHVEACVDVGERCDLENACDLAVI